MIYAPPDPAAQKEPALADELGLAHADLVNSGRDTRITFSDGSTIVVKGVSQPDEVFASRYLQPAS
jgi:hypothetical protein